MPRHIRVEVRHCPDGWVTVRNRTSLWLKVRIFGTDGVMELRPSETFPISPARAKHIAALANLPEEPP